MLPDADGYFTVNERSKNGGVTGNSRKEKASPPVDNVALTLNNVIPLLEPVNPPNHNALIPDCGIMNPDTGTLNDDTGDSTAAVSSVPSVFDEGGFALPAEAPLPMREQPPISEDPAVVLTVKLRRLGVNVMSTNPYLIAWVDDAVPFPLLAEAISLAREQKPEPEKIAPGYLVPIIAKLRNPPAARQSAARAAQPLNEKFHFNHLDRSGDVRAMEESMKRWNITVPEGDEEIEI
jgi:hypothetical protein